MGSNLQYGHLSEEELKELQKLEARINAKRDKALYILVVHDER